MDEMISLPAHAYVPGKTPRHEEGLWDEVRETAKAGMDVDAIAASPAFRAGMAFYRNGFFWEAHEVWEAVWMACPPNSSEYRFVQALIQLANAELKLVMEKPRAASRLCAIAEAHLGEAARSGSEQILSVSVAWTREQIRECRRAINIMRISAI